MSLSVAIDFTASNGQYNDETSLHKATGGKLNDYTKAIKQVGEILEQYDHFKNFPCFGFGGVPRFMGERETSHCFPLNGNFDEPEICGIDGILKTYNQNIEKIHMAGPTFFSSIMDIFMDFAVEGRDLKTYFVLLILTDGEIHDMNETKKMIIEASKLPCSIIIIGIGDEDFDMMIELDSDDKRLKDDKNNEAKRDIVQFVKFDQSIEMGNLAVEVLKEVPAQVCRYMEMIGYEPKKINADMTKIDESIKRQKDSIMEKIQKKQGIETRLNGPGLGSSPVLPAEQDDGSGGAANPSDTVQKKPRKHKKPRQKSLTPDVAEETKEGTEKKKTKEKRKKKKDAPEEMGGQTGNLPTL